MNTGLDRNGRGTLWYPPTLVALPRWVNYRLWHKPDGTTAKVPITPDGRPASTSDPSTWRAFSQCRAFSSRLGFVFNGDGIVGIDLDGCIEPGGDMAGWAYEILARWLDNPTYFEVSPSRTGIKIFARGKLGRPIRKSFGPHCGIEAYSTGRFFVVTGNALPMGRDVTENQIALDWLTSCYGPPPPRPPRIPLSASMRGFTMAEFISRHSIPIARQGEYNGDGMRYVLAQCPFNPAHLAPDAVLYERGDGTKHFRCSHNSCSHFRWREFREHYEK